MEESTASFGQLAASSKKFARRLMIIGENRLELLAVEVQEGRERLLRAFLLALGAAAFGLLAGIALTTLVVVLFWKLSPVFALVLMIILYGTAAVCLYRRLAGLLSNWQTLSATLDQLQKDRACLEEILT